MDGEATLEQAQSLLVLGEAVQGEFREYLPPVRVDFERPASPGDQLRRDPEFRFDRGRQPGGPREVVSDLAVFDTYGHWHSANCHSARPIP